MIKLSTRRASSARPRKQEQAGERIRSQSAVDNRGAFARPVGQSLRVAVAGLVVALTQAGCAVGPDFKDPNAPAVSNYLPGSQERSRIAADGVTQQSIAKGGDVAGQWWALFKSRHLNGLVEKGLAFNADLQAAEAAVRVAQANALAQRGALFPTVNGNYNLTSQKFATQSTTTNAASGSSYLTLHTLQLSVAYVVDVFGGTRRLIEAADAQAEVAGFQREAVFLTLTSNIVAAAIQEASLRGQIDATKRLIKIQSEVLAILRTQERLGQIALPDVLVQETALAQTKLLLPPLDKALAQQRHLIAVLTGGFPSEDVAGTFQIKSFRLPRKLPLSLTADLVRQRPDIRAAEAAVHATNAQVGVAIANRLPQITLTANAGSSAAESLGKLFTTGTAFWLLGTNAAQTLFDGRTLENRQKAAEETLTQSMAQYRSTVLVAFQNVADVLSALQADARALSAAIDAELSAQRNIELIRAQVEQGQVSVTILLAAQQAYLNTSLARVQAEAARLADTVALFQALGGGWWNRQAPAPELKPEVKTAAADAGKAR